MPEASIYLPDQILKDAAKHGELVVFVGAGASMLCGSPDWRDFKQSRQFGKLMQQAIVNSSRPPTTDHLVTPPALPQPNNRIL